MVFVSYRNQVNVTWVNRYDNEGNPTTSAIEYKKSQEEAVAKLSPKEGDYETASGWTDYRKIPNDTDDE